MVKLFLGKWWYVESGKHPTDRSQGSLSCESSAVDIIVPSSLHKWACVVASACTVKPLWMFSISHNNSCFWYSMLCGWRTILRHQVLQRLWPIVSFLSMLSPPQVQQSHPKFSGKALALIFLKNLLDCLLIWTPLRRRRQRLLGVAANQNANELDLDHFCSHMTPTWAFMICYMFNIGRRAMHVESNLPLHFTAFFWLWAFFMAGREIGSRPMCKGTGARLHFVEDHFETLQEMQRMKGLQDWILHLADW